MIMEREPQALRRLRDNADLKALYFLELIDHGRQAAEAGISPSFSIAVADVDTKASWMRIEARCRAGIIDETLCPQCFFVHGEQNQLASRSTSTGADRFWCDVCAHEFTTAT